MACTVLFDPQELQVTKNSRLSLVRRVSGDLHWATMRKVISELRMEEGKKGEGLPFGRPHIP